MPALTIVSLPLASDPLCPAAQWGDAPSLERNQLGALYVVFAVVFCSWILKNLFVAVIVQSYTRTHAQLLQVQWRRLPLNSADQSIMAPYHTRYSTKGH